MESASLPDLEIKGPGIHIFLFNAKALHMKIT